MPTIRLTDDAERFVTATQMVRGLPAPRWQSRGGLEAAAALRTHDVREGLTVNPAGHEGSAREHDAGLTSTSMRQSAIIFGEPHFPATR